MSKQFYEKKVFGAHDEFARLTIATILRLHSPIFSLRRSPSAPSAGFLRSRIDGHRHRGGGGGGGGDDDDGGSNLIAVARCSRRPRRRRGCRKMRLQRETADALAFCADVECDIFVSTPQSLGDERV